MSTEATAMAGGPYSFILFGCRTRHNKSRLTSLYCPPMYMLRPVLRPSPNLSLSCVLHATPIVFKAQRALQPRVEYVSETYAHAQYQRSAALTSVAPPLISIGECGRQSTQAGGGARDGSRLESVQCAGRESVSRGAPSDSWCVCKMCGCEVRQ